MKCGSDRAGSDRAGTGDAGACGELFYGTRLYAGGDRGEKVTPKKGPGWIVIMCVIAYWNRSKRVEVKVYRLDT